VLLHASKAEQSKAKQSKQRPLGLQRLCIIIREATPLVGRSTPQIVSSHPAGEAVLAAAEHAFARAGWTEPHRIMEMGWWSRRGEIVFMSWNPAATRFF
jgi:hypothetical protein